MNKIKLMKALHFGKRILQFQKHVEDKFLEREDVLEGIFGALMTRQHALITGLHGTAKSAMVTEIFKVFGSSTLFNIQCTKFMTEDALFGVPDIRKMQREGIMEYNVEGMLPTASFAYLDEFFDANDACMRSMLDILNERQFRRGRQFLKCPLRTAIATSNFMHETDQLAAVVDRFLVRVAVSPLVSDDSIKKMLADYAAEDDEEQSFTVHVGELDNYHRAVKATTVPKDVLQVYCELLAGYAQELDNRKYISDRRKCWALDLARHCALTQQRTVVTTDDLAGVEPALVYSGSKEEVSAFSTAYTKFVSNYASNAALRNRVANIENVLAKITARVTKDMEPHRLVRYAGKVKEIIATLSVRETTTDAASEQRFESLKDQAEKLLADITPRILRSISAT